ncbi:putative iron-regulated membrane protein [Pseudomonas psychrotolerans]|nr:putative iron-regulated membrane protein [Pseudomonas psychrotolerans]
MTGALYSFQLELLQLLNPPPVAARADQRPLTLPELRQRLAAPGQELSFVSSLVGEGYGMVGLVPAGAEGRGEVRLFDRYSGDVLESPRGQGFFDFILKLHRSLALGSLGRTLTGAATLILLVLCLSGLYLRWPRQARRWRTWLTLDWARRGRSFHWDLHAVVGTWCLLLYLLAALTGLYWSYGWYREASERLLGAAPEPEIAGVVARRDVDLDALWQSFRRETGGEVEGYGLLLPNPARQVSHPTLWYLPEDAAHVRALNRIVFDGAGRVLDHRRYREQPLGARLLLSVYALHSGEYFGLAGRVLMLLASLAMPVFLVTGLWLYLDRRRKHRLGTGSSGRTAARHPRKRRLADRLRQPERPGRSPGLADRCPVAGGGVGRGGRVARSARQRAPTAGDPGAVRRRHPRRWRGAGCRARLRTADAGRRSRLAEPEVRHAGSR